jgi:hypothetical protein
MGDSFGGKGHGGRRPEGGAWDDFRFLSFREKAGSVPDPRYGADFITS